MEQLELEFYTVEDFREEIHNTQKKINDLLDLKVSLRLQMQSTCKHPIEFLKKERISRPSSSISDYPSYCPVCGICGKQLI